MRLLLLFPALLAQAAAAETVVATRTLKAHSVIGPADVTVVAGTVDGAARTPDEVVGLETRAVLFKDRPISGRDLGAPSIVARNQIVPLHFAAGPLAIEAEGRALDRGGAGDLIRVMNTASRKTVSGTVLPDGTVAVQSAY